MDKIKNDLLSQPYLYSKFKPLFHYLVRGHFSYAIYFKIFYT